MKCTPHRLEITMFRIHT